MLRVSQVDAIMIHAENPARMADWYASFLGIQTTLNTADNCYYGDIAPGFHLGIYPIRDGEDTNGSRVMVNYRVDDFVEFLNHLQNRGVTIDDTQEESCGWFAHFRDCEGNRIEIWAEKK